MATDNVKPALMGMMNGKDSMVGRLWWGRYLSTF